MIRHKNSQILLHIHNPDLLVCLFSTFFFSQFCFKNIWTIPRTYSVIKSRLAWSKTRRYFEISVNCTINHPVVVSHGSSLRGRWRTLRTKTSTQSTALTKWKMMLISAACVWKNSCSSMWHWNKRIVLPLWICFLSLGSSFHETPTSVESFGYRRFSGAFLKGNTMNFPKFFLNMMNFRKFFLNIRVWSEGFNRGKKKKKRKRMRRIL